MSPTTIICNHTGVGLPWCPVCNPGSSSINPPDPKAKFGASKPDVSLIPPVAIYHEAMAMEEGAYNKPNPYGPFNWRDKDVEARTYLAAALRHVLDLIDGIDYTTDPCGARVHNAGAARASLGIFLDAQENGRLIDNRPLQGKASAVADRMRADKLANASRVAEGQAKAKVPTLERA